MGRENRQEALAYLVKQAEIQGYVTFDNIMDCADANYLPITDFDWLTNAVTTRGILIYDEDPINRSTKSIDNDDHDDYAQSDYEAVYKRIIELDESLTEFVNEVRNIVPPQWKEFEILKYQVLEGNRHARNRIVEMYLRLALKIALQRTETYDMDIQDAVGEACIGLLTAVDKYNPDINGPFGSYASMWILQNISRRQSTQRSLVYYPVHKKEPYFVAYPIAKQIGYNNDSELFDMDEVRTAIINKTSLPVDEIDDVIEAMTPFESYEVLFTQENDEQIVPNCLVDDAEIDQSIIEKTMQDEVKEALAILRDKERQVIELRYGLDGRGARTLEEVGSIFNVTRERIRQIEAKAIRKMRNSKRFESLKEYL